MLAVLGRRPVLVAAVIAPVDSPLGEAVGPLLGLVVGEIVLRHLLAERGELDAAVLLRGGERSCHLVDVCHHEHLPITAPAREARSAKPGKRLRGPPRFPRM